MPQKSTLPLVHTVAVLLVAAVLSMVGLGTATATGEATYAGYLHHIGATVADLGSTVADIHVPQDLNGDGVLTGDLELGA